MTTATATPETQAPAVTPENRFLFDLQGYIVLRGAVDRGLCEQLLRGVRAAEARDYPDAWREKLPPEKRAHRSKDTDVQSQIRLNGLPRHDPIFDEMIGHPAILPYLNDFMGDPQLVNTWSITKFKGVLPGWWHSGYGPEEYVFRDGTIRSPMLNVVTMLTPNTPGDGCLIVQPGSHKRNLALPSDKYGRMGRETPGAVEITGDVGDVVLFCESLNHNGDAKSSEGLRTNLYYNHLVFPRSIIAWDLGNIRHYWMPPEVRARFTPEQKKLTRWMEFVTVPE